MTHTSPAAATKQRYRDAANRFVTVANTRFAYRELGSPGGVPLVLLNHWGAVLDNFDPRIVDGLATSHHIIALDYKGIGLSGGIAPVTIDEMARDMMAVIRKLGFETIDLMGFSLGGFVAQDIALKAPALVRKLILTGTGPAGGDGIAKVGAVSWPLILKGMLTLRDPKTYLFFTSSANGRRAAKRFLARLKERSNAATKALRHAPSCASWMRSKSGAVRRRRIWVVFAFLSLSPMETMTSWCRHPTAMTWPAASRMRSW
ncbi:putative non-heme bromoperoxidase BpoC [compost metagenome]